MNHSLVTLSIECAGTPEQAADFTRRLAHAVALAVRAFVVTEPLTCRVETAIPSPGAQTAADAYKSALPDLATTNDPILKLK